MISSRWPRPIGTERVERLEPGLHRLVHRLARDDARRLDLDAAALGRLDRALAVDRVAERVDDAAEQRLADRNVDDGAGALDGRAFGNLGVRAEDHDADIVGLEVERHALGAVVELDHLAGLDVVEAVDARDSVADREHGADFGDLRIGVEIRDLVADDAGDFSGADIHGSCLAFHRGCETVEFGADGSVDLLASQLDDDSAENVGIDRGVDVDVAAGAGAELLPEGGELVVVERPRGDDFGGRFAAMLGGEAAEGADDAAKLVLAAVAGEHAEEVGGDRDRALSCGASAAKALPASSRETSGLVTSSLKSFESTSAWLKRFEALADRFDLPLVAREVEQSRRIAPC